MRWKGNACDEDPAETWETIEAIRESDADTGLNKVVAYFVRRCGGMATTRFQYLTLERQPRA